MRTLVLALLVAPALAAGCLQEQDPAPLAGTPREGPCGTGEAPLFVRANVGAGLVPDGYMSAHFALDRDGDLFKLNAVRAREPGSGMVRAGEDAELVNVTLADVKAEMLRLDAWRNDTDYTVRTAWRDTVDAADFDAFCARTLSDFYALDARHDDTDCADGATWSFNVSTEAGTHRSSAYCDAASDAFEEYRDAFRGLVSESERKLDVRE